MKNAFATEIPMHARIGKFDIVRGFPTTSNFPLKPHSKAVRLRKANQIATWGNYSRTILKLP